MFRHNLFQIKNILLRAKREAFFYSLYTHSSPDGSCLIVPFIAVIIYNTAKNHQLYFMKRILVLALVIMAGKCFGQIKPGLIGFSVDAVSFTGNSEFKGKYDPGFSVLYWKGISRKLDFSVRYNGLFSDYAKVSGAGSPQYINEFEASLHLLPFGGDHGVSPFLTAGAGTGNYGNRWAVYSPLGGGIQFRLDEENYIFLQANYRVSWQRANLDNNLFFSLAFTESINTPKKAVVQAPPPVPAVIPVDSDHDGVPDSLDACPTEAGPAELKGCPDSDGDGIADKDDKCPNQKGLPRYNGCPIPDSDGDGINDEEDKCPHVAGVKRYGGCPIPDRDGDGVNDEEDKCPDLAGDKSNQGCPVVKEEVVRKANYAAQHVFFQSASFVLLKKSFQSLDEIALLMNSDPALKLYVDGYTDNSGKPEKNLLLSENRAAAVKKYLTGKGIAAERIQTAGHGSANPIADNKTAAGRAKNRRVEMRLDYL